MLFPARRALLHLDVGFSCPRAQNVCSADDISINVNRLLLEILIRKHKQYLQVDFDGDQCDSNGRPKPIMFLSAEHAIFFRTFATKQIRNIAFFRLWRLPQHPSCIVRHTRTSWTLRKNEETRFDAFEMKGLRKILRVSLTAMKTNEWFLTKLEYDVCMDG